MQLLTPGQLAAILNINEPSVSVLVANGQVPHTYVREADGLTVRFHTRTITQWLQGGSVQTMTEEKWLQKLKASYQARFPEALAALKEFSRQYADPRPLKGYTLSKVPSKRYGFLYYVRYIIKGKMVPSRWCTHTNDRAAAERYAVANREAILEAYYQKKKAHDGLYGVLESYYQAGSEYLAADEQRGRTISPKTRSTYSNFMQKVFTPFLEKRHIQHFNEITPAVLACFQDSLLAKGNKAQTINRFFGSIKAVFNRLVMTGTLTASPFDQLPMLKAGADSRVRGCYEVNKIKGVFNKRWKNPLSQILCLLIYTTGMRNSEIERIQTQDICTINNCRFIKIKKSKTKNGLRMIPLHPFVHRKLICYIRRKKLGPEDYLFVDKPGGINQSTVYRLAAVEMGALLGCGEADLEAQNISFYSGRHYWKTLMNANGLGEVEEYFMGHKVSRDVAKRYNHLDKQGKRKLLQKAREVFAILDRKVFKR
jgi:site-specific recombinase XerD